MPNGAPQREASAVRKIALVFKSWRLAMRAARVYLGEEGDGPHLKGGNFDAEKGS